MAGLPQSGTGQIALLTGQNAPAAFGRHFGPWPPVSLRPDLLRENLLVRARQAGLSVAFANALPRGWPGDLPSRRHAAPPLAALAAGLLNRHVEALVAGEAVASEFHNEGWRRWTGREDIPAVTPAEAGQTLVRIAAEHDLTFFAHYATDHAGHRGGMRGGRLALERVDAALGGMLNALEGAEGGERPLHLVLASDHGNVEDVRGGHTRNPALGLEVALRSGSRGRRWVLGGVDALTGVTPALLRALGVSPRDGRSLHGSAPDLP